MGMAIKIETPIGIFAVEEKNGMVYRVYLPNQVVKMDTLEITGEPSELLRNAETQFTEYFSGRRKDFDLPLDFGGCSEFTSCVYKELTRVKYGETASYKDIAERVGSPKAYRAVGLANNKNPLPIIVPCHRIVGADGSLVGYAGGLEMKRWLLDLESKL